MAQGNFGYEVTLNDYFPPNKRSQVFKSRIAKSGVEFASLLGEEMANTLPRTAMEETTPSAPKKPKNGLYGGLALGLGAILIYFILKGKK